MARGQPRGVVVPVRRGATAQARTSGAGPQRAPDHQADDLGDHRGDPALGPRVPPGGRRPGDHRARQDPSDRRSVGGRRRHRRAARPRADGGDVRVGQARPGAAPVVGSRRGRRGAVRVPVRVDRLEVREEAARGSAGLMGIFVRWGFIGLGVYAEQLWDDATEEAVRSYRETADRDAREELRNARSDWLAANRAERSFPCGVVPDQAPAPGETPRPEVRLNVLRSRPLQVIAAVLPDEVAFLREERDPSRIVEVGRIPRAAIQGVDVVDEQGNEVPQPLQESFEPSKLAIVELRWLNGGAADEDRFAFRSAWIAWQAARHLQAATKG